MYTSKSQLLFLCISLSVTSFWLLEGAEYIWLWFLILTLAGDFILLKWLGLILIFSSIFHKSLLLEWNLSLLHSSCIHNWGHISQPYSYVHCVLLKHYYSVDFPWWFDRKNCFTKTANEMMIFFPVKWQILKLTWQKCKTALCGLTEKLLVSNFIGRPNLQIILEANSKSIDFFFYYIRLALIQILMI